MRFVILLIAFVVLNLVKSCRWDCGLDKLSTIIEVTNYRRSCLECSSL